MKKRIRLIFTMFIFAILVCGCTGAQTNKIESGIVEDSNVTAPGTLPIVKEKIVLDCAIEYSETVEDYETNDYTKWLEEQTGIGLDFEIMKNIWEMIDLKINSGEKIPGVIMSGAFNEIAQVKNGINGNGILLELGDYMDNYSYWLNDLYTKSNVPNVERQLLAPDGNRYFMPRLAEQEGNSYGLKTWINKTWLEKLGMEMPKTTEEFREVMIAFTTLDPNGNGKKDERGMLGNIDGWCAQPHRFLINSFISECNPDITKYANVGEDGKLYINFTKDEYRDALRYISGLVREGLIDDKLFSRTGEEMIEIASSQDNVVGCFTSGNPDIVFGNNRQRMVEYEALPPLEGPDGINYAYVTPHIVAPGAFITKYCKYPLAAFRLLDFMMSKEATLRSRYGVEGRDWEYASDDDICIFAGIGKKATVKSNFQFGFLQNATWENRNPEFRYADIANGMAWNGDPLDGEKFKADALAAYYKKEPEKTVSNYYNTVDEYEELNRLEAQIIPYAEKEIKEFILCNKDIENDWDAFMKKLDSLGIERYLELLQLGYDRYENSIW